MLKPAALVILVVIVHAMLLGVLSRAGASVAIVITVVALVILMHAKRRLRR